MPIARERNSGRVLRPAPDPAVRIVFFSEGAAEFFETAVGHLLGWDLITERERNAVTIFDMDDGELRADLVEAASRMGGHKVAAVQ